MKENLKPGPRGKRRRAVDGTICPPASEGHKVYRGLRSWRKVCKFGHHKKDHPGRCIPCRRLSDKKRSVKNPDAEKNRRERTKRWEAKPENKAKKAEWARRRNSRPEQKAANAARQRLYRRGMKMNNPGNPKEVAAKLLAKASQLAGQARYGIVGKINLERR